jgi:enterochelin esterase family protein
MRTTILWRLAAVLLAACAAPIGSTPIPTPTATATSTPAATGVTIDTLSNFASTALSNTRTIRVLLPPGYARSGDRHYRVLYLNDGQDLESLRLKPALEQLYAERRIAPPIVVAVHTTADRLNEYGVAGIPDYKGRGARADAYTRFLLEEVVPAINRRYRTLTGPHNTAIAGSSLGGLSAFDIAWRHADVFGTVGVFSGSFWWRTDNSTAAAQQSSRIMPRVVRETAGHPRLHMWFEAGTLDETEDRDDNGVIDAIQDTTDLMDELARKGYVRGQDMLYVEIEGGRHNQQTWAQAMPDLLKWAFPNGEGGGFPALLARLRRALPVGWRPAS